MDPVNLRFTIYEYKWDVMGCSLHGFVFVMRIRFYMIDLSLGENSRSVKLFHSHMFALLLVLLDYTQFSS